jgi:hypothetical protein
LSRASRLPAQIRDPYQARANFINHVAAPAVKTQTRIQYYYRQFSKKTLAFLPPAYR